MKRINQLVLGKRGSKVGEAIELLYKMAVKNQYHSICFCAVEPPQSFVYIREQGTWAFSVNRLFAIERLVLPVSSDSFFACLRYLRDSKKKSFRTIEKGRPWSPPSGAKDKRNGSWRKGCDKSSFPGFSAAENPRKQKPDDAMGNVASQP